MIPDSVPRPLSPYHERRLTVTICSWNTLADTRACLASLEPERADFADLEVIVVDNNSEDGSPQMIAADFHWVRLEAQAVNLGFTGGHNLALRLRRNRDVLLLNSDTIVHRGALAIACDRLHADPKVGVVGPKLLNPDGSLQHSCRRFPDPIAAAFRNTMLGRLWPNNPFAKRYLMADFDHAREENVDWVSGAAMLVKGELLDQIGGFDEAYFMYCEDVDLCWQAWERGFEVRYVPSSVIVHAIGRSSDQVPNRMIGRFHRSMLRFYVKNMAPKVAWPLRPLAIGAAALAVGLRAAPLIVKNRWDRWRRR